MGLLRWLILLGCAPVGCSSPPAESAAPGFVFVQFIRHWTKLRTIASNTVDWINTTPRDRRIPLSGRTVTNESWQMIDYNPKSKSLYWSSQYVTGARHSRKQHHLVTGRYQDLFWGSRNHTSILTLDGMIGGIVVDCATGNVYLTDQLSGSVIVVREKDVDERVIRRTIVTGMNVPGGITLDSKRGWLYWLETGSNSMWSSESDGEGQARILRQVVAQDVKYDEVSQYLYWADSQLQLLRRVRVKRGRTDGDIETLTRLSVNFPKSTTYRGIDIFNDIVVLTSEREMKLFVFQLKEEPVMLGNQVIDAEPQGLVLLNDERNCTLHRCSELRCQDFCFNGGGGEASCACREDYVLEPDGRTCSPLTPHYVFTSRNQIWSANVTLAEPPRFISTSLKAFLGNEARLSDVKTIAFHHRKNLLYLAENRHPSALYSVPYGGGRSLMKTLTVNLALVAHMVVDWSGKGRLCWADNVLKRVTCCRPGGEFQHILFRFAPNELLVGLLIEPSLGRMFFGLEDSRWTRLYSADMEGSDRKLLLNRSISETSIRQMDIDLNSQKLVWSEGHLLKVNYIRLQNPGRVHQVEKFSTQFNERTPMGIALYKKFTAVGLSDCGLTFGKHESDDVDRNSLQDLTGCARLNETNLIIPDLISFESSRQPQVDPGRCATAGCQHHCYELEKDFRCRCAFGYSANGTRCESGFLFENFLLFADPYHRQIYQMTYAGQLSAVPIEGVEHPTAVTYDDVRKEILWVEGRSMKLMAWNVFTGETRNVTTFELDEQPKQIVVGRSGTVYYSSTRGLSALVEGHSNIRIVSVNSSLVLRPLLLAGDRLFWGAANGSVWRYREDGSELRDGRVLFNLREPARGIAISPDRRTMYVSTENSLFRIDLNTNQLHQLFTATTAIRNLLAISVDYHRLYFSSFERQEIFYLRLNQSNSQPRRLGERIFSRISSLIFQIDAISEFDPNSVDDTVNGKGFPWLWAVVGFASLILLALLLLCCVCLLCLLSSSDKKMKKSRRQRSYYSSTGFDDPPERLSHINMFDTAESPPSSEGLPATDDKALSTPSSPSSDIGRDVTPDLLASEAVKKSVDRSHYRKNRRQHKKLATVAREERFSIPNQGDKGTKIQRLAERLRHRIATIRFGEAPPPEDEFYDGDKDAQGADFVPVVRTRKDRPAIEIHEPLHQQARGFAPASHATPSNVKGTVKLANHRFITP